MDKEVKDIAAELALEAVITALFIQLLENSVESELPEVDWWDLYED